MEITLKIPNNFQLIIQTGSSHVPVQTVSTPVRAQSVADPDTTAPPKVPDQKSLENKIDSTLDELADHYKVSREQEPLEGDVEWDQEWMDTWPEDKKDILDKELKEMTDKRDMYNFFKTYLIRPNTPSGASPVIFQGKRFCTDHDVIEYVCSLPMSEILEIARNQTYSGN